MKELNEEYIKELIGEEVRKYLNEGIDIIKDNMTVDFNPNHQEYVDTNNPCKP